MIGYFLPERAAVNEQLGHPSAGVVRWLNRNSNTSGVNVNEDVALTYSAVWAATRVISETVATLPCILYRRIGDGKERARDDDRFGLVHDSPNDMMTPYTYFETTTSHMALWGNEYSKIVSIDNQPSSLEVRLPDRVLIEPDDTGNSFTYEVEELGESIQPRDMLHVAGIGFDGIKGYSVVSKAAQSIGTAIASEQHAGSFFGNGAQPSGALVFPQRLEKAARDAFRKSWDEVHGGSTNANKIAILHGGMTYQTLGMMSHDDAQFLESRQFSISDVGRWFRIPNHLLNDLTHATFSNIEHQSLEFVKFSILPWVRRWESALNKKLLRPGERREMFFEFLLEGLLRGDLKTRSESNAIARQWGWKSVNEIRAEENMNPVDNGNVYLEPMNMQPAGTTPDAITKAWQECHSESIRAIADEATKMREQFATAGQPLIEAEERLQSRLSGVHDQQAEMRKELAGIGLQTQVAVSKQHVINAALDLIADGQIASRKREAQAAIKAAKAEEFTDPNTFISWLDSYYVQSGQWLTDRIAKPSQALQRLDCDCESIVADHVASSKELLLTCTDGPREGFAARVHDLVINWHEDTNDVVFEN